MDQISVLEVYGRVREQAEHYFEKSNQKKITGKQKELYVNLAAAFNIVSAWLEETNEVNPKK